ncbi:MAG: hypothetical protein RIQ33_728 [Bacteroidota bacterium]
MDNNYNDKKMNDSVYSLKFRAGKRRTYFFDVRSTRGNDYFVTLTESTRRNDGDGYERHKIFLYKEDFNEFMSLLNQTVNHVKNTLMPDYDYDEFALRRAEAQKLWEEQQRTTHEATSNSNDSVTEKLTTNDDQDVDKW